MAELTTAGNALATATPWTEQRADCLRAPGVHPAPPSSGPAARGASGRCGMPMCNQPGRDALRNVWCQIFHGHIHRALTSAAPACRGARRARPGAAHAAGRRHEAGAAPEGGHGPRMQLQLPAGGMHTLTGSPHGPACAELHDCAVIAAPALRNTQGGPVMALC